MLIEDIIVLILAAFAGNTAFKSVRNSLSQLPTNRELFLLLLSVLRDSLGVLTPTLQNIVRNKPEGFEQLLMLVASRNPDHRVFREMAKILKGDCSIWLMWFFIQNNQHMQLRYILPYTLGKSDSGYSGLVSDEMEDLERYVREGKYDDGTPLTPLTVRVISVFLGKLDSSRI